MIIARALRLILMVLLTALVAACSKPQAGKNEDFEIAQITSYNHTHDYIHEFYVNGAWGGNSFAYKGGGKFVCCIKYPHRWHAGLTAKVRWHTSSSDPKATGADVEGRWHETVVPIDKYVEPGTTLNVHFLPDGDVRLVISSMGSGHPDYPGPPYPVKPADFKF